MRLLPIGIVAVVLLVGRVGAEPAVQGKPFVLKEAGLLQEIKNNQRETLTPPAGQAFLWIKATASQAVTIDLTKVAVTSGATSSTLSGVDANYGGDPTRFVMIAPALKNGALIQPLEQTGSDGSIAFAFTPGKTATVKILQPPQSFCLLFSVPRAFQTGQVKGLGAEDLKVPSIPGK